MSGGIIFEGGELAGFMQPTAALIVFGGLTGAILLAFPMSLISKLPSLVAQAIMGKSMPTTDVARVMMKLAERARREGLLALEEELPKIDNILLKRGVTLVIDGTDPELVRGVLEADIVIREKEHENGVSLLEGMGGYAPTMGIIGTVCGLVNVLSELSDPANLGHAIAVAFIATLYGIGSANLLFLPLASQLKKQAEASMMLDEMVLEGLASIQSGENPRILQERLEPYLPKGKKASALAEEPGEAAEGMREGLQAGRA